MRKAVGRQVHNRLATARGHLAGVQQMAADSAPCPQIIYQLRAVQGALVQVEELLIREHLHHCLNQSGRPPEEHVLREILQLWNYTPTAHKARARRRVRRASRAEPPAPTPPVEARRA